MPPAVTTIDPKNIYAPMKQEKIYCAFHKLALCHIFELKIKSDHHIQEVTAAHQLRLKSHLDHGKIKHLLDHEELVIPQGSASVLCLPAWYT